MGFLNYLTLISVLSVNINCPYITCCVFINYTVFIEEFVYITLSITAVSITKPTN